MTLDQAAVAPPPRPPLDLRLLPAAGTAWAAAWLAPAVPVGVGLAGGALAAAFAALALVLALRHRTLVAAALALALGVGAAAGLGAAVRVASVQAGPIAALADQHAAATVDLRVTGDPVTRTFSTPAEPRTSVTVAVVADRVRARGRTTEVRTPLLLRASGSGWADLIPGQRLTTAGLLAPG